MSKTLKLTFISYNSFPHFPWMSQFPKVVWQFDPVAHDMILMFFLEIWYYRKPLRPETKGNMLLITGLTYQRPERLMCQNSTEDSRFECWNPTWEIDFGLWKEIKQWVHKAIPQQLIHIPKPPYLLTAKHSSLCLVYCGVWHFLFFLFRLRAHYESTLRERSSTVNISGSGMNILSKYHVSGFWKWKAVVHFLHFNIF